MFIPFPFLPPFPLFPTWIRGIGEALSIPLGHVGMACLWHFITLNLLRDTLRVKTHCSDEAEPGVSLPKRNRPNLKCIT